MFIFSVATLLWKSERMTPSLPKWGLRSPPGFLKLQSLNATCIEAFSISLESYQSVDVENGLAWAVWTSVAQVMMRSGVKLAVWLPTTKSQESTRTRCVQVEWDTPLESYWRGIQLCFRPHRNRRFAQEVMRFQSDGSPSCWNFGTPTWESWDKKPFGCGPRGELHNILYGGRWWLPPNPSRGESCESKVARGCPSIKGAP